MKDKLIGKEKNGLKKDHWKEKKGNTEEKIVKQTGLCPIFYGLNPSKKNESYSHSGIYLL